MLRAPRCRLAALILFVPVGFAAIISVAEVPRMVVDAFYIR